MRCVFSSLHVSLAQLLGTAVPVCSTRTPPLAHSLTHVLLPHISLPLPLMQVLERHHAHVLFTLLLDPRRDLLGHIPPAELRGLRATILKAVLATDMSRHFHCVSELADRRVRLSERMQREAAATAAAAAAAAAPSSASTAGGSGAFPALARRTSSTAGSSIYTSSTAGSNIAGAFPHLVRSVSTTAGGATNFNSGGAFPPLVRRASFEYRTRTRHSSRISVGGDVPEATAGVGDFDDEEEDVEMGSDGDDSDTAAVLRCVSISGDDDEGGNEGEIQLQLGASRLAYFDGAAVAASPAPAQVGPSGANAAATAAVRASFASASRRVSCDDDVGSDDAEAVLYYSDDELTTAGGGGVGGRFSTASGGGRASSSSSGRGSLNLAQLQLRTDSSPPSRLVEVRTEELGGAVYEATQQQQQFHSPTSTSSARTASGPHNSPDGLTEVEVRLRLGRRPSSSPDANEGTTSTLAADASGATAAEALATALRRETFSSPTAVFQTANETGVEGHRRSESSPLLQPHAAGAAAASAATGVSVTPPPSPALSLSVPTSTISSSSLRPTSTTSSSMRLTSTSPRPLPSSPSRASSSVRALPASSSAAETATSAAAAAETATAAAETATAAPKPSSSSSSSSSEAPDPCTTTTSTLSAVSLPFDRTSDVERNELVAVLVHSADLSGQAYPEAIASNWGVRILAEFRREAAISAEQGLPVIPFMGSLDTQLACARVQLSFVSNIVLPLWQRLSELFPDQLIVPLRNLHAMRLKYEAEVAAFEREAPALRRGNSNSSSSSSTG